MPFVNDATSSSSASPVSRRKFDVTKLTNADLAALGKSLGIFSTTAKTMESAAERAATLLFQSFENPVTGEADCALARIFKTHPYSQLSEDLQTYARRQAPEISFSPETTCLTLIGTAGLDPAWNSRHLSAGHRAIALASVEVVERAPMIANLFRQLGCELEWVVKPNPDVLLMSQRTFNVFFVEDAHGSEFIPSQTGFVIPFGIRSVVGFGGALPTGELFVAVMFLKTAISSEVALRFSSLALELRALLGQYEGRVFFK